MIPRKCQFQELTKACASDRLSASLNLISGNATETRIRTLLKGYDETLKKVFKIYISPLPAYKWLGEQQGFIQAQRRAFPDKKTGEMANEVDWVIQQAEKSLESKSPLGDRKTILRSLMRKVAHRMQRRHYWIGVVSKCLCAYHYPNTPNMGKMKDKCADAGKKVEEARQALLEVTEYSEYMPWVPLPNQELIDNLNAISEIFKPENIRDLTPIKRADISFMERLFVIQLANGHAQYLHLDNGIPAVIADLFYLEGFGHALDERSIRKICADQQRRRDTAYQRTAQAFCDSGLKKRQADS